MEPVVQAGAEAIHGECYGDTVWQSVEFPDCSGEEGVVIDLIRSVFLAKSCVASCAAVTCF